MGGKGGGESSSQQYYPSSLARNQPEFKNQTLAEKLGGEQLPITAKKEQPIVETQTPATPTQGPATEAEAFSNPTGAQLVEGATTPQPLGNQFAQLMRMTDYPISGSV